MQSFNNLFKIINKESRKELLDQHAFRLKINYKSIFLQNEEILSKIFKDLKK